MNRRIPAALAQAALFGFWFNAAVAQQPDAPLTSREKLMLERIEQLEKRLAAVEARITPSQPQLSGSQAALDQDAKSGTPPEQDSTSLPGFISGTTLNFDFDGYYEYNFNRPAGRVNLLRA